MKNYFITFYIEYPYYLPHVLPIVSRLKEKNKSLLFVLSARNINDFVEDILKKEKIDFVYGEERLQEINSKYFFFLNHNDATNLKGEILFMGHAIGTKKCAFDSMIFVADKIFVEGDYRYEGLRAKFPKFKDKIYKVGYSKLDFITKYNNKREIILNKFNLNPSKKTILYAPTFYPSSIEKMSKNFPADFKEYNIIVKPHYLSLNRKRYKAHQKRFAFWSKFDNIYICGQKDYDLTPFLAISDLLISDESSAVFEFSALNKPVILNRFLKLRLSYYLFPKKLQKRLDSGMDIYRNIGPNPKNYKEMVKEVKNEFDNPKRYEKIRLTNNKKVVGVVDGNVSQRVVEILFK